MELFIPLLPVAAVILIKLGLVTGTVAIDRRSFLKEGTSPVSRRQKALQVYEPKPGSFIDERNHRNDVATLELSQIHSYSSLYEPS